MKAGITVYFVRHGQTQWNFDRRIQGQIDTDLNQTGRTQAAGNGCKLKALLAKPSAIDFVASPLRRCRETMEIIRGEIGLPGDGYTTDDRLKEIHFGHWQERYWPELARHDPAGVRARAADPYYWRPDGGESYADLTVRAAEWLDSLECDTVAVSHGGVSRALRGHLLDCWTPEEITELRVPQDKVLVLRMGHKEWV